MKHRFTAPMLAVLVLALAAFTGSALAGDNHGSGSGDSGKAAKQDHSTQTAPTTSDNSTGVKPSNTTKPQDTKAAASSNKTKQYGNGQTAGQIATKAGHGDAILHGPGNSQPHKTAVCPGGHEVDVHALKNKDAKCGSSQVEAAKVEVKKSEKSDVDVENSKAEVDVENSKADVDVEKSKAEESKSVSAVAPAQAQVAGVQETQNCGTTTQTVTEQVLVGVKHMIGPKGSGRFVLIHPSEHSAHYTGKHKDDIPVYESVTKTITVPTTNCPAALTQSQSPAASSSVSAAATAQTAALATTSAPVAAAPASASATAGAAPAASGGVKGAVVALKPTKTKPAGGVLGATTRLGGNVASTTLPFTGLPLWIFALVAAALIGIGLTARRASARRI
ncbi:MAG: hypothetical protein JWO17_1221 [Actinomycetia bacterium]|nr:hypothetical protein [Actinomycetes bacterium]